MFEILNGKNNSHEEVLSVGWEPQTSLSGGFSVDGKTVTHISIDENYAAFSDVLPKEPFYFKLAAITNLASYTLIGLSRNLNSSNYMDDALPHDTFLLYCFNGFVYINGEYVDTNPYDAEEKHFTVNPLTGELSLSGYKHNVPNYDGDLRIVVIAQAGYQAYPVTIVEVGLGTGQP